jgi:hypothetical protein
MEMDPSILEQSDAILCRNVENLQFQHKKETDGSFMNAFFPSVPCGIRDIREEYKLWTETFGTRPATCDENIMTRGGNNHGYYGGFNPDILNKNCELLLDPCSQNTFKNYLVGDDKKICSLKHQTFNNITKRR